jgi:hypothetical protein
MAELADRIEAFAGVPARFERPYKACDYKPLYSCLLDLAPGHWEFWGHCDLDMIFGDVRAYLTPRLLAANDRIFGLGHFSVYRNDDKTNNFYRLPHPALDYREILSDSKSRGFDEHLGVNKIWRLHRGRFHEDESVVADIDPHTRALRRTSTTSFAVNSGPQLFGFDRGRVFRLYKRGRRMLSQDFMYVHFQKRHFSVPPLPADCESAWLTPSGFIPMDSQPMTRARLQALNPSPILPPPREVLYRVRHSIRLVRRKAQEILR